MNEIEENVKVFVCNANIPVHVTTKNNIPAIELRKLTTNKEIIKMVVSAAAHNQPLIIFPTFRDKMCSIASLIEKGVLYYDTEEGKYFYR